MENQEVWKSVIGYEGLYEISNYGRLKALAKIVESPDWGHRALKKRKERILKCHISNGYVRVQLSINKNNTKELPVHRLVAQAFIPNPENKLEVNHINCIKHDNRVENLEWCTSLENKKHARKMGLLKGRVGEDHPHTTLKNEQVIEIYLNDNLSCYNLSKIYSTSQSTIVNIKRGKTWQHITSKLDNNG